MRTSRIVRALAAALAVALVLACGGGGGGAGGGGGGGGNQGVTLNLYAASLAFGQTLNLTGSVPGVANQVILWSASGGSIAPTGPSSATYTAPSVAGTYTITATSDADHNKRATVSVTVSSVGISIDPPAVTLGPNAQTTFTATVVGATNTAATFTCSGGTITQSGPARATYRAPATIGSYTVTAKATANTTKIATATVTVANVGSNATVTGKVVVDGTQSGIQGITVAFYNVSGSEVARATTNVSGNFNATVPTTARRWHLVASSIPAAFYKAYSYAGIRYAPLVPSCSVPLPTLTPGNPYNLPGLINVPSAAEPPPPPPNGCGG